MKTGDLLYYIDCMDMKTYNVGTCNIITVLPGKEIIFGVQLYFDKGPTPKNVFVNYCSIHDMNGTYKTFGDMFRVTFFLNKESMLNYLVKEKKRIENDYNSKLIHINEILLKYDGKLNRTIS